MSNPVYRHGPISFEAASLVEQGRLVTVNAQGLVEHASESGPIFGAVSERRDPSDVFSAKDVAVHYGVAAVKLKVAGGDATAIKAGAPVFAAADGFVAASGTVQVGVAAWDGVGDKVLTVLNGLPAASAV